ncbi:hypothetical protein ACWZHB_25270 [Nocardia sp. FBN12]|uniref:hypothetical protein n=1 Tax=Nocardia sp. FBN12 TaxID=3419766 RepID=UPI003CFC981F
MDDDSTAGGVVEVEFVDADGAVHSVIDKLPAFLGQDVDDFQPDSPFPMPCPIEVIVAEHLSGGRTVVGLHWSVSTNDQVRFIVPTENIAL